MTKTTSDSILGVIRKDKKIQCCVKSISLAPSAFLVGYIISESLSRRRVAASIDDTTAQPSPGVAYRLTLTRGYASG